MSERRRREYDPTFWLLLWVCIIDKYPIGFGCCWEFVYIGLAVVWLLLGVYGPATNN